MKIYNPFKEIIFVQRTWIQLFVAIIFVFFDLLLFVSTYKYIKIYFYYTRALKNISVSERGYAREKLGELVNGFFPYADLLAASIELENNSPKNALEILNKLNYQRFKDDKLTSFSELLKGLAYILLYNETRAENLLSKIEIHLTNANKFCPTCSEPLIANALVSLLHNNPIEAYKSLLESVNNAKASEKNALNLAVKLLGEIDLDINNKCEKAIDNFQKAVLYNPQDVLSSLKYHYCNVKNYKLKGEKGEIDNLRYLLRSKLSYFIMDFSKEEKYYYSLILMEIGKLYKNEGTFEKAYELFGESLKYSYCNFDAVVNYEQILQQEISNLNLSRSDRDYKAKILENLEEHLAQKIFTTPLEMSEFLNCQAVNYYRIKNNLAKALDLLEKARSKNPTNAKVLANFAILYIKSNEKGLAKGILDDAYKKGIQSELLDKIRGVIK